MTELNMRNKPVHSAVEFKFQVFFCDLLLRSYNFMSMKFQCTVYILYCGIMIGMIKKEIKNSNIHYF